MDKTGRNCRQPDQTGDWNFLINEYTYSQAACLADSFYTRVADACNCIVTDIPEFFTADVAPYTTTPVCTFKDLCCNFQQYTAPVKEPCVTACTFDEYRITGTSYSEFPATHLTPAPLAGTASANVFFETLSVENQETEFSYDGEEFLAEVGGQMGLFIGVSIMTFFEFVFFVFDAFVYCVKGKPCKARRSKYSHESFAMK